MLVSGLCLLRTPLQCNARARWLMAQIHKVSGKRAESHTGQSCIRLDCNGSFHNQFAIQKPSASLMATSGLGSQVSCKARHFDATDKEREHQSWRSGHTCICRMHGICCMTCILKIAAWSHPALSHPGWAPGGLHPLTD